MKTSKIIDNHFRFVFIEPNKYLLLRFRFSIIVVVLSFSVRKGTHRCPNVEKLAELDRHMFGWRTPKWKPNQGWEGHSETWPMALGGGCLFYKSHIRDSSSLMNVNLFHKHGPNFIRGNLYTCRLVSFNLRELPLSSRGCPPAPPPTHLALSYHLEHLPTCSFLDLTCVL